MVWKTAAAGCRAPPPTCVISQPASLMFWWHISGASLDLGPPLFSGS